MQFSYWFLAPNVFPKLVNPKFAEAICILAEAKKKKIRPQPPNLPPDLKTPTVVALQGPSPRSLCAMWPFGTLKHLVDVARWVKVKEVLFAFFWGKGGGHVFVGCVSCLDLGLFVCLFVCLGFSLPWTRTSIHIYGPYIPIKHHASIHIGCFLFLVVKLSDLNAWATNLLRVHLHKLAALHPSLPAKYHVVSHARPVVLQNLAVPWSLCCFNIFHQPMVKLMVEVDGLLPLIYHRHIIFIYMYCWGQISQWMMMMMMMMMIPAKVSESPTSTTRPTNHGAEYRSSRSLGPSAGHRVVVYHLDRPRGVRESCPRYRPWRKRWLRALNESGTRC